jgi:amino acid permease
MLYFMSKKYICLITRIFLETAQNLVTDQSYRQFSAEFVSTIFILSITYISTKNIFQMRRLMFCYDLFYFNLLNF